MGKDFKTTMEAAGMTTELEKFLATTPFKANRENFQRPLIFKIHDEDDFLKMVNCVFSGDASELDVFEEFFELVDDEADDFAAAEFYDLYDAGIKVTKNMYTDSILRKEDVVFHHQFDRTLLCVIYFSDDFDRFGDILRREFFWCDWLDLDTNEILIG